MSKTHLRHARRIALLLATSVGALTAGSAHADAAAALDEVVVVGSRRAEQTALGAVAPVDVFSAERLAATGQTDLNGVLQSIAPSFSFPRVSGNDATAAYRPAAPPPCAASRPTRPWCWSTASAGTAPPR